MDVPASVEETYATPSLSRNSYSHMSRSHFLILVHVCSRERGVVRPNTIRVADHSCRRVAHKAPPEEFAALYAFSASAVDLC